VSETSGAQLKMPAGLLPQYQRVNAGVPVSMIRKSLRPREKCLILLVFATLGVVCFGAFFYLPDYGKVKPGPDRSVYYKVYQHVQKAGEELLMPPFAKVLK
jgi:hypothetical protein